MQDATKDLRPVDDQDGRSADAGDPGADEVEILSIEGGDPADAPAAEATASTSEAGSETPGGEPEFFRRELEELRDRSLRAMADFDNFRKRAEREREDIKRYALAGALGELLPVVDNLERAVAAQGSLDDLRRGIEMTLRQLQVGNAIDHRDFLDRVDTLSALGWPVLISNFLRYHRLVRHLSRHTDKPIGLPLGIVRLRDVLDEKYYTDLPGGLLESLGQLFKNGAKLYIYPSLDRKTGKLATVDNFEVAPHLRHLYSHLVENRFIENIRGFNQDYLSSFSGDVLEKIKSGDATWERHVPPPIARVIKDKKLFCYQ